MAVHYSLRRHEFYSDGSSTSAASSTAPPPSPTPPSPVCLKWRPASTSTSRPLSERPSGPCSSSPVGKRPDRTRCLLRSTSAVVPKSWNHQLYDNHRGISLLNIAGKIFACILLGRLNSHLEQGLLPESQCGFRRHHGTPDMIFAA
ncbi:hypothetical protein SprV_0200740400 [Sparganum proliferum]